MANIPPVVHNRGAAAFKAGIMIGDGVWWLTGSAAPTDGTSGTGAGFAAPGSMYTRASTTNSKLYINTNTTASPTWTVVGAQS